MTHNLVLDRKISLEKLLGATPPHSEIGGILLGWRHERGIYIKELIEIPDEEATPTRYRRRHARAEKSLVGRLAALPVTAPEGYVGEWHTHLAPRGPSLMDRCELRRISLRSHHPVGLVVFCRRNNQWTAVGVSARRGRMLRTQLIREGDEDE